jgi:hypothetical protein
VSGLRLALLDPQVARKVGIVAAHRLDELLASAGLPDARRS